MLLCIPYNKSYLWNVDLLQGISILFYQEIFHCTHSVGLYSDRSQFGHGRFSYDAHPNLLHKRIHPTGGRWLS